VVRGRPYNAAIATAQKWAAKIHASAFRATGGGIGGRMVGSPVLLLVTTGRKSGLQRTTVLLYLEDGGRHVIVASNGGTAKHPAWWLNLQADPEATIEVGARKTRVRATEARGEEKVRLWQRLVRMYPSYEDYQKRTDREIPVIILEPVEESVPKPIQEGPIVKTIDREALKEKMDRGGDFLLLEVLGEASFNREHLPGAVRYEGRDQVEALAPDRSTAIVAYCSNFN
jgi:F420H(2)-dependent quinone reductase